MEQKTCYAEDCNNPVTKGYFCSKECQDSYWPSNRNKNGREKLSISEIQFRLKEMGKKVAEKRYPQRVMEFA